MSICVEKQAFSTQKQAFWLFWPLLKEREEPKNLLYGWEFEDAAEGEIATLCKIYLMSWTKLNFETSQN